MTFPFRLCFILLLACSFLPARAAAQVVNWEGAFNYRIDAQTPVASNGLAEMRFRYRGEAGDQVWATLLGAPDSDGEEGDTLPLRKIVLEYDASGGKGVWETAKTTLFSGTFEIRAPANGVVEFRVRAKVANATERFRLEYGGDTKGAQPFVNFAADNKDTLQSGYNMTYSVEVPRGNSSYEFEVWTDSFKPGISLENPKGGTLGFFPFENGPRYEGRRYHLESEGTHKLTIRCDEGKGGTYTLRRWYPLPLKRRK